MRIKSLLLLLWLSGAIVAHAQQIKPNGYFLQDSMALGEPIQYSLSVEYPSQMQLLFPDSLYDFSPFEYESKQYFPTVTDSTTSRDSVVYTFTSFEVDEIQKLTLPVFLIRQKDSMPLLPATDSVIFKEMIPVVSDTLQLKEDPSFATVPYDFNYPYLIIGLIILFIILIVVAILFGKRITTFIRIWLLTRKHNKFIKQYSSKIQQINKEDLEKYLYEWKRHLEKLNKKPYAKLTTKEIYRIHPDESLKQNLSTIDKGIYSNATTEGHDKAFNFLKEYAGTIFQQRVNELKTYGK